MHLGFEKARGDEAVRSTVAVIGDSTFIHSGITGLIDMVYNKGTGTVIIMDNRVTAMTGHQEHPATGYSLMGEPTHELDLEMMVRACGVKRVVVIDPKNVDDLERVIKEEVAVREPSVIITRRKCILKR
jgi:indolepyruvate ferredoxin oxidoreductase alpha subunit